MLWNTCQSREPKSSPGGRHTSSSQGLIPKSLSSTPLLLRPTGFLWCQLAQAPLLKILRVFCLLPSRVYYVIKSYHALPWPIQYRSWFLSEMTAVVLKQRKNPVLFSRRVIALTQSNEYLISKQNPRTLSSKLPRSGEGAFLNRFSLHPLLKNVDVCQVENV